MLLRAGLTILTATAIVSGQGTEQPPPQQPTGQPTTQAPRQGATFRAAIDHISLDIVPRDSQERYVPNLKKEEVQVLEDGVLQTIDTFLPFVGGRALGSVTAQPPRPVAEGIIMPAARPPIDTSGRIFVIFVDDLHLQALLTPKVRDLMKQIKDNLLHEGDLITIVSSGPSSIEIDQTYDLNRMDEARSKIMGAAQSPKDIIMMPNTSQGPPMLRYNVRVAFGTAYSMLTQLEKITNKRKSFIYISSGYDFNPFQDSRYQHEQELYGIPNRHNLDSLNGGVNTAPSPGDPGAVNPFEKQGQQFAEADLVQELAELTRAANRANTSFYTIDPRGLMANIGDISENLTAEEWGSFVNTTQSSLRVLADETGGMAVVNMNDFAKALKQIDALTSDYYILGYYSSNPDPLHRVRKIEIRLTRPGLHLLPYKTRYAIKATSGK